MEKFHLPIAQEKPVEAPESDSENIESRERELKIREKIARAFLRQRYPLTPEGERLKSEVAEILESGDTEKLIKLKGQLPTVEHPHLELFADLEIEGEGADELFAELADVQVTKGCRHQCTFCAAGASNRVEIMPFAGVLKIAEEKRKSDEAFVRLWEGWGTELKKHGIDPEHFYPEIDRLVSELEEIEPSCSKVAKNQICDTRKYWEIHSRQTSKNRGIARIVPYFLHVTLEHYKKIPELRKSAELFKNVFEDIVEKTKRLFQSSLLSRYLKYEKVSQFGTPFDFIGDYEYEKNRTQEMLDSGAEVWPKPSPPVPPKPLADHISNYYDSDPFDYRDVHFLHEDGTPADYGDVFEVLATEIRPIHITTAGWPRKDKVAQRAAEKLVELYRKNPKLFSGFRISVTPFDITAMRDVEGYLNDMRSVISTLQPDMPIEVLFYDEHSIEGVRGKSKTRFEVEVKEPLKEIIFPSNFCSGFEGISTFSGRAKGRFETPWDDSDYDVMACMPGLHVWPDGTVARQEQTDDSRISYTGTGVPVGSRPTPTGERLFSAPEKIGGKAHADEIDTALEKAA